MEYKSPLDMLYRWEENHPDKVYLRQPIDDVWHTWTWKQAAEEVRRMATALIAMNLPLHSNIVLISKNCAHWIMCDLAIMMSGHISVPLYPNLAEDTIRQILEHCNAPLLFVGKLDDWPAMKAGVPEEIKCISLPFCPYERYENWNDIIAKYPPLKENISRNLEEIVTIIYTSGTTGLPKGVIHKYYNFSFAISNAIPYLGFTNNDRFFSYLPLSHIAERILVEMGSLYTGGEVYFAESLKKFSKNLAEAQPTIFLGVHRIWSKFQEGILKNSSQKKLNILLKIPVISGLVRQKIKRGLGLAKAINIFTGASPTPVALIKWFEAIGIKIQEAYAMTENCCYSHVTQNKMIKIGFVGQALPECEAKLDHNDEILIRHEALMVGYYKEHLTTNESFTTDGFLRTGDQGLIDEEGYLQITGRVKDLFKTGKGKYVAPSPIEMKMSAYSDLEFVCIVGTGLQQPIAMVTLSESGKRKAKKELEFALEQMLITINATLDAHEKLAKVVVLDDEWTVENGMLTPSFKIKRHNIEKKYAGRYEKWHDEKGMVVFES